MVDQIEEIFAIGAANLDEFLWELGVALAKILCCAWRQKKRFWEGKADGERSGKGREMGRYLVWLDDGANEAGT